MVLFLPNNVRCLLRTLGFTPKEAQGTALSFYVDKSITSPHIYILCYFHTIPESPQSLGEFG